VWCGGVCVCGVCCVCVWVVCLVCVGGVSGVCVGGVCVLCVLLLLLFYFKSHSPLL
jgi:hypothetical protein